MREKISKGYCIHEMEFGVLLAVKGLQELYGMQLNGLDTITQTDIYQIVFNMLKKGFLETTESRIRVEEVLDHWIDRIKTAECFIVCADVDELIPESYFYIGNDNGVFIQPVGQQGNMLYLENITRGEMWDYIQSKGLQNYESDMMGTEISLIELYEKARDYWIADKEYILQEPKVKQLLQEYDMHTKCKKKQIIKFIYGLDEYILYSDNQDDKVFIVQEEGEEVL
ncbi:MAG: hypothetical protein IJO85_08150 [Lachnospiraceae bacterium]|nr:hypothetical protein [Lachnospiraceae bacterium]